MTISQLITRLALVSSLAFALPAAGQDQPLAGQYEVTTTTTYTDVPVPDTTVTTQHCMTQEDLDQDPASIFAGLPDGKTCEVGEFLMEAGTIRLHVNCSAPDGDMVMITEGTFDGAGYQMLTDVTVTVGDEQVKMRSTIDGKLLGDC
jgi:hypothetical protein